VLKVDPDAKEGAGTVKIMNADPGAHHFSRPAFKLVGGNGKNHFEDSSGKIAIIPLWAEGERQGVLVITPDRRKDALDAALNIQKLISRFPEPRQERRDMQIRKSQALFINFYFGEAGELARKGIE
jgi:hypothetical protein